MLYVKPHIKLRTVVIMANEIIEKETGGVPDWMREASTGASIGNIDASDLKPPQLKMLAGMSPEVMNGVPGAIPGNFWMTVINQSLGRECVGSMVILRKTYQIWAPKGSVVNGMEARGPLATSSNGVTWDIPNQTFEIRHAGTLLSWKIGKLVTDFGVHKFGSSNPDDPMSKPIATLTYNMLWAIDLPNGSQQLCALIAARTMTDPTQKFITAAKFHSVDHYFQRYRLVSLKKTGPTGDPYFVWEYQFLELERDRAKAQRLKDLYTQYAKSGFVVDLEAEVSDIRTAKGAAPVDMANKDVDEIPF